MSKRSIKKGLFNYAIIIIVSFMVVSCSGRINRWQLDKATKFCADKGGIDYMNMLMSMSVTCINGKTANISTLKNKNLDLVPSNIE